VAGTVPDSGGVTFVPALAGLGCAAVDAGGPRPARRAADVHRRGHIARAVAEGIASLRGAAGQAAAADLGRPLTSLRVDGGLTRSRVLLQAQADLLQVPGPGQPHTRRGPALGVAALASLAMGEAGSPSAEVEHAVAPRHYRRASNRRMSGLPAMR